MKIRIEREGDREAVHAVNTAAFESSAEAHLVDALRQQSQPIVSLVAEEDGEVVGHIMFSVVTLPGQRGLKLMGLGPMAVAPGCQRKGVGSALVKEGIDRCRSLDVSAVVVLGHPEFYPRFGFVPSTSFGINSEYDVPEEVFMTMELIPGSLNEISGTVKYHSAFGDL